MKSLMVLVLFLMFVSNDCKSSDKLTKMCRIFKPKGVFGGVKAYRRIPQKGVPNIDYNFLYTTRMFSKGMEWEFVVRKERIILLEETLTSINREHNHSIILRVNIPYLKKGVFDCLLIRLQRNKRICYFEKRKEVDESTDYSFDSMLAIHSKTIPKEITDSNGNILDFSNHLFTGLIDRQNCLNDKFYSFKKNAFTEEKVCWNNKGYVCEVPKFLADIPIYWRLRLDAIIELRNDVNKEDYYWLILFNNNSKPLFCVFERDLSFTKGCSDDKLKTYGDECNGVDYTEEEPTTTPEITTLETTTVEITDTNDEKTSTIEMTETTPGIDWLPTIVISIVLTAFLSMVVIALIWFLNKSDQNYADIHSFLKVEPQKRKESDRQKLLKKYNTLLKRSEEGVHRLDKL